MALGGNKKILIISHGFAMMTAVIRTQITEFVKDADLIIVGEQQFEMSPQDVQERIQQFQEPKIMKIERLPDMPEPQYYFSKEPKPWKPPQGKGKKYHDKHNFRKRL